MAQDTNIEWCDMTFNPWIGCTKVSEGCAHCYAETRMDKRLHVVEWGPGKPRKRTSAKNWEAVRKWNRLAGERRFVQCSECGQREFRRLDRSMPPGGLACCTTEGCLALPESECAVVRPRVFVASLADWLDPEVPIEWLADLLELIDECRHLDFLLLTKRPELWKERMDDVLTWLEIPLEDDPETYLSDRLLDWYNRRPPCNVWMGTTVENHRRAEERIPALLKIPARVRFLSCEPLLDEVWLINLEVGKSSGIPGVPDEFDHIDATYFDLHWVICGGESGPSARPMDVAWARDLRDQCASAGIAFFMKQMGGPRKPFPAIPEDLQVREWPR